MSIKLSYDICKTVQYMHVNVINKSKKLKELRNEIKSLYNLSQPFQNSCVNTHTFYKQQNSITASIANINNRIYANQHALTGIESKLKEKYDNKKIVYNLIKNQNNISMNTDEVVKNNLLASIEKGIKELNQQKETLKIRLNKYENTLAYFNNKSDFLSYPNQETLNFLFYTEVFPNRIERESIPKEKINIDCINNMINIHKKSLFISSENKEKINTYKEFLKKINIPF
ncbi:hypothetical protein [Proteus mirabilis]|uniref:hypothetical protein n=1 Tax=Proteus mirabilis TaxID=584 RepID=UPI00223250E0|nr:hypothetical protein [Proteus mirabilis]MDC5889074.1 hypothetical protein [Proteus mirabilis]MDC5906671.1 hypothetical protein [Proteus mirabilis]MDC5910211.1 hypothetical protein [Proteus mirabilis]MDC5924321.1 hypothetical protein [Proteus mirabilis]MDC5934852.1 hypothetical protein [Proteus mirabilis]